MSSGFRSRAATRALVTRFLATPDTDGFLVLMENSLRISCTNNEQEEAQEELEVDYAGDALDVGFTKGKCLALVPAWDAHDLRQAVDPARPARRSSSPTTRRTTSRTTGTSPSAPST